MKLISWFKNLFNHFSKPPEAIHHELWEIMIKAGRRCAYDLHHAAEMINGKSDFERELRQNFIERSKHWQTMFTPVDRIKSYRVSLHCTIDKQSDLLDRYRALCKEQGIDNDFDDYIPF